MTSTDEIAPEAGAFYVRAYIDFELFLFSLCSAFFA